MVRPPGFEPGSSAREIVALLDGEDVFRFNGSGVDWEAFRDWLAKDKSPRYVRECVCYGKRYVHCLLDRDFSDVRDAPETVRPHIVKALSNLSKFLGMYDVFKELMRKYGIGWKGRSTDDVFIDRLLSVKDPEEVWNWIKEVKRARPELCEFMDFVAITGLRINEAVRSYNLVQKLAREGRLNEYYNVEREALEHFRFKELFIRRTKKAFVSFVPKEFIKKIVDSERLGSTHNGIRKRLKIVGLNMRFHEVRKAHATILTKYLRQPEIDFIQGRVSSSIFMANYFNPALISDLKDRVFKGISEILAKIS